MESRLAAALTRVRDEVCRRYEGPTPESLALLTAFGKDGFDAVLLSSRDHGPAEGIDERTRAENWHAVLAEFARINPRWLVETFDDAASQADFSALVWILGINPSPAIAPDLMRWLDHRDKWVREHSLTGLIRLRWEAAIPVLLDYLQKHPTREDAYEIVRGMFFWEGLRQPRAVDSLRRIISHLEKKKNFAGVLSWARELAESIELGTPLAPRPPGFGSL